MAGKVKASRYRLRDPQPFPIIETFGYPAKSSTEEAKKAFSERWCPFAKNPCEKYRQYGFGYCSVTYAAQDDEGIRRTYAVCDHRVDGDPLKEVIRDHFGPYEPELVPEVVLTNPRTSFDYVAIKRKHGAVTDAIAIETQAIDIRGGGVGPAFKAWQEQRLDEWRAYFTAEAEAKGRKDNIAYGVNMANIYKRLGLQVAEKGTYLKAIGVPFYVVMQNRPFEYLHRRVKFSPVEPGEPWDITFMTFDYTGRTTAGGQLEFSHARTVRTTLTSYTSALAKDQRASAEQRGEFMNKVESKARQGKVAPDLLFSDD